MEYCRICGDELHSESEKLEGICWDCQSAMLQEDDIDLGLGIEDDEIF